MAMVVILLMDIGRYYINGYGGHFINGYGGYFINGYWWLLY
jgi:hypothetical protein